jgi:UDP-N-acetylmuramoyl-L-alanyl-D-glutamate--2,6-diaminopimelate ligase
VTLRELLEETEVLGVTGSLDIDIAGIGYDSRRVRPGEVFFALSGQRADGRAFVEQAIAAGAAGVVVGRGLEPVAAAGAAARTPIVEVGEPRLALARAAARWHGHPSRALEIVGVTGTNGKTTTTWMLESIFRAAERPAGVIGTTGYRIGEETRPAPFTTPEAPELQGLLREMVDRGVKSVAMEVSSHALVQRRSWGVEFDAVVFTNLTQDHLDYHGTMEAYLDAKLMLFDGRNGASSKRTMAVVNADDPAAPRVIEAVKRGARALIRYAVDDRRGRDLEIQVAGIDPVPGGLRLVIVTRGRGPGSAGEHERRFTLPMMGRYNAANAAAAFTAALALGIDEPAIVRGLASLPGVPGRLERVDRGQPFEVVVDYAHTPDALARALAACREHARGRVLLVFGCGGERDRGKRPLMGRIASEASDGAWVTNDNPRGEDPAGIAAEITAGSTRSLPVILERRDAIAAALAAARAGDLVLIAGKGHETTQTIGRQVLPFDDRAVAAELLAGRRAGT